MGPPLRSVPSHQSHQWFRRAKLASGTNPYELNEFQSSIIAEEVSPMHKSIMQRSGKWILVILVTAVLAGSAALLPLKAEDEGFRSLVPEQDISELWVPEVTPAESWSLKDGVIISTGKPTGYLRSKKKYRNYILKVDWRYKPEGAPPDANSGIFLSISGPPQRLPKCIAKWL